jgi:phosphatidylinositol alpha-mannosyltransferase
VRRFDWTTVADELLAVYETVTAGADAVAEDEIRPWRDRLRRGMDSERLRRGGGAAGTV